MAYRWYVLGLFTVIYAFNFIDRQIITIVAPYVKADLGLTDAQIGLLYGTAFALFYALFGLPLAKLADGWNRVRALSIGLILWSAMTTLSGYARSFAMLGAARMGVGVGEASASPAAFSILQDYFPKAQRATALAVYSAGIFIGSGASLMIGGWVIAAWERAYPHGTPGPFGLTAGWQAAFLAVGIPGVFLGLLTWLTVREPVRGAIDGTPHPPAAHPFRAMFAELGTLFAPFSVWTLRRLGASGHSIRTNLVILVLCLLGAWGITVWTQSMLGEKFHAPALTVGGVAITTNAIQWFATAIAVYAIASWIAATRLRDPLAYRLMVATPSFAALSVAGGLISFGSYAQSAFIYLYGKTYLGMDAQSGFTIGALHAVAGGCGTVLGGVLADQARKRWVAGRIYVAMLSATLSSLFVGFQLLATTQEMFFITNFLAVMTLTMWLGPIFATGQDHVVPKLRGTATATQFLGINLIGLGLGPYCVGLMSDITGDLRLALASVLLLTPVILLLFLFAARRIEQVQANVASLAQQG